MSDTIKKYEEDIRANELSYSEKDIIEVGGPTPQDILQNNTYTHGYELLEQPLVDNPERFPVEIEQLDHGVLVRVGCKKFAFTTTDEALYYVKLYLEDTTETSRKFYDGSYFYKGV